jgi:predicted RNA binding protein YcfA (HicA-like mRNA interferase family)
LSRRLLAATIAAVKVWQVIGMVEADGWQLVRTR